MLYSCSISFLFFFFFNDTATTEIYTLSLHDALPISQVHRHLPPVVHAVHQHEPQHVQLADVAHLDRKSTRLNSSHSQISYAVFCLKKKKKKKKPCYECTYIYDTKRIVRERHLPLSLE